MDEELQGSGAVGGGPTGDDPAADDGSRAGPAVPPPAPIPTVMAPTVMAPTGAAGPPRRSRFALVTAAAVLVVAAVVGIVVGTSGGSHGTPAPGRAPGAAVLDAIDSTLGAKTAALHLSMVMDVPGAGQITATGDGQIDFSSDSSQLTVGYQGIPTLGTTKMTEIYTGGSMYLSMPQITTLLPGKSWIAVPVGSSSAAPGSSNPAAMFQILRSQGDQVTPLGPSTIDGAPVEGYHVVVTQADVQRGLTHSSLPASMVQSVESELGSAGMDMDVYVDSSTGLMRRMDATLHLTVSGQPVSATVTEDTTDYGTPVSIAAPPADQVASFQQFAQGALGSLGTTPGS